MKSLDSKGLTVLSFLVLLLAGCSVDPNKRLLKYLNSGEVYFKAGKYQETAIQFRNAVKAAPRSGEAHYQLALAYLRLGNSEAAYRELIDATSLSPMHFRAQGQLATLLLAHQQDGKAQAAL